MVARKPLTIGGRLYKRGAKVPWNKVEPKIRRLLIEQRRVLPLEPSRPSAGKPGGE